MIRLTACAAKNAKKPRQIAVGVRLIALRAVRSLARDAAIVGFGVSPQSPPRVSILEPDKGLHPLTHLFNRLTARLLFLQRRQVLVSTGFGALPQTPPRDSPLEPDKGESLDPPFWQPEPGRFAPAFPMESQSHGSEKAVPAMFGRTPKAAGARWGPAPQPVRATGS